MAVITRKDGRVYCSWRDESGKQLWESFGRGKEAKKKADQRDLEIKLEKSRSKKQYRSYAGDVTFQELTQIYIDARYTELAKKTRSEILRVAVNDALPVIGNRYVSAITKADLQAIEKKLLKRVSVTTCNRYIHYLAKIFAWGVEKEITRLDPWRDRKPLRVRKKFRIDLFTLEEFQAIMAHAPGHLRWALGMEYHTGLRPGPTELFALKWSDVNWDTGAIRIYASKTDTYRIQYVSEQFLAKMLARKYALGYGGVLCEHVISYRGKKVNKLRRSWLTAKNGAGITRPIRLYDIRHFYCTHALANGANILDLAKRMGHVNPDMIVRVYSHLADDIQKKQALKLPDLYQKKNRNGTDSNIHATKVLTKSVDKTKKG